jgi:hypothetical protein
MALPLLVRALLAAPAKESRGRNAHGSNWKGKHMAKRKQVMSESQRAENVISLRTLLEGKVTFERFRVWIVGDTPLITHSWSEKARLDMLRKQVKALAPAGRQARDPEEDFQNGLYEISKDVYAFPTMAAKLALMSAAHQDKGISKTSILSNVWIDCQMFKVRPALAGAVCDMPLTRIYGSKPQMREDMVRVGAGLQKTSTLAYRPQFFPWAAKITGRFNPTQVPSEALAFLFGEAGRACGLCDWRNEKRGVFGAFHIAREQEELEWQSFALGKGPMPVPESIALMEAAE